MQSACSSPPSVSLPSALSFAPPSRVSRLRVPSFWDAMLISRQTGQLFPCKLCRRHLQGNLADAELGPVAVESREALSIWMCKLHNSVNRQNGKAEFPCEQHKLDLMYLKSCSECKEKFDDGAVHQAMIPWSASLYARSPHSQLKSSACVSSESESVRNV